MARKMKAPVAKYFGTPEEISEITRKHLNGDPLTLEETSKVMGLSKSAIRAIEMRALAKLKKEFQKRFGKDINIGDFIDLTKHREGAMRIRGPAEEE